MDKIDNETALSDIARLSKARDDYANEAWVWKRVAIALGVIAVVFCSIGLERERELREAWLVTSDLERAAIDRGRANDMVNEKLDYLIHARRDP